MAPELGLEEWMQFGGKERLVQHRRSEPWKGEVCPGHATGSGGDPSRRRQMNGKDAGLATGADTEKAHWARPCWP